MKVVVQKWEVSERGWGCRPDGNSLHGAESDRVNFIRAHNATLPDAVPDEYSRPCGSPYEVDIAALAPGQWEALVEALVANRYGLRVYGGPYPGSGGTDGWMPSEVSDG